MYSFRLIGVLHESILNRLYVSMSCVSLIFAKISLVKWYFRRVNSRGAILGVSELELNRIIYVKCVVCLGSVDLLLYYNVYLKNKKYVLESTIFRAAENSPKEEGLYRITHEI